MWFWEISRISLVGGELPLDDLFLARPSRVPTEEPPTKNSVKITCLTNVDRPCPELTGLTKVDWFDQC